MIRSNQLPRSIRNCNPGNIMWCLGNQWLGQIGKDKDGFCIFSTTKYGARAQMRLLLDYYTEHHLLTIGQIIDRWSNDNDQVRDNYKNFVSKLCGLQVHQPVYYFQSMFWIAYAMADFEAGETYPYRRMQELGYQDALNGASTTDALPLNA